MASNLVKGFKCECENFCGFSLWVYAHWDIALKYTCYCGRKYFIRRGEATPEVYEEATEREVKRERSNRRVKKAKRQG